MNHTDQTNIPTLAEDRRFFRDLSVSLGGGQHPFLLSTTHKSALARKGYTQRVVHLLPHRESINYARSIGMDTTGWKNLCEGSTRGCRYVCLTNSGQLALSAQQRAAFVRTVLWQAHRDVFLRLLAGEIRSFVKRCEDQPVIRLYGTHDGDILVDAPGIVEDFPTVIFNDYTKLNIPTGWVAPNVYRVRSATENTTPEQFAQMANEGQNHAVPFLVKRSGDLPATYMGMPVIDGDRDDLRFLDPTGVIVGLRYKTAHKRDVSKAHGFIREVPVTIG